MFTALTLQMQRPHIQTHIAKFSPSLERLFHKYHTLYLSRLHRPYAMQGIIC